MTHEAVSVPTIESPPLSRIDNTRHAFFTREGGVSQGLYQSLNCGYGSDDTASKVAENRNRVCSTLAVPAEALITPYQVHGTDVVLVEEPWSYHDAPEADGLVTRMPGIALGILTADCAPVLFADPETGVIGACHAGWRGALDGIIDNTLESMEKLGAKRESTAAVIGPCIAQESYQVGPEFRDQFIAADSTYEDFFKGDQEARFRFDLPGFVLGRLTKAGIGDASWVGLDTCSEDQQFFSYRRSTHRKEPDFGRGLSAIVLAEA